MKQKRDGSGHSAQKETAARGAGWARFADSPAATRNKTPILDVLREILPKRGLVLEIASGTGQHVVHFARALPDLEWLPTEHAADLCALIAERVREEGLTNVRAPLELDASSWPWPVEHANAVVCINMTHIAPWSATEGLVAGAARVLPPGGVLYIYGPFRRFAAHTAPSNEAFDASLRARNPEWGVRDLEAVVALAEAVGLQPWEVVPMPANNFSIALISRRARASTE